MPTPAPAAAPGAVVRVVVLNFDGGDVTLRCLRSLIDHPPTKGSQQIVMVDNASVDGVIERVQRTLPQVRVIESLENLGFAGGCNLGMTDLDDVDYVALINNDAYIDDVWLDPLIDALAADTTLGAVCPKILFAHRVRELVIGVDAVAARRPDTRLLGVRLSGARRGDQPVAVSFDERWWAVEPGEPDESWSRWSKGEASVRIPASCPPGAIEIRLSASRPVTVTITDAVGNQRQVDLTSMPQWVEVDLPDRLDDVINNVGSNLYDHGYGGDRGFLDIDRGQFDEPTDVFAWCGGAVLMRVDYLREVGLFDERFFLYYEDTDLSWRGKLAGWRYRTEPRSVVRHEHAMSSGGENSPVFRFHVDRNRVLMLMKCAPAGMARTAYRELCSDVVQLLRHHVLGPWLRRAHADTKSVAVRFRSLRSATRLTPSMLRSRRAIRRRATITDDQIRAAMVTR